MSGGPAGSGLAGAQGARDEGEDHGRMVPGAFRPEGSVVFDVEEYRRWVGQARHTLASARRDASAADYAWASFKAQQAAEYALKGLHHGLGRPAAGHSTLKLAEILRASGGISVPEEVLQACRTLDRHYTPTRYADVYPTGMPYEYYDEETAEAAVRAAEAILAFVERRAAEVGVDDSSGAPA